MNKRKLVKIRKVIHFVALIALLSLVVLGGSIYFHKTPRERKVAQVCAKIAQFRADRGVTNPDMPLHGRFLPFECLK